MSDASKTDQQLLCEFIEQHSDAAFAEIVRRHFDWIHSVAHRQAGAETADDLTQAVFLVLLQKARVAARRPILSAWLFGVLRYAVLRWRRDCQRQRTHEQQAAEIKQAGFMSESGTEILPVLDELLAELGGKDRQAILVRFYERRTLAETGSTLGISEEAARKRVDRALEKLRRVFAKRGITAAPAILSQILLRHAVTLAPQCAASMAAQLTSIKTNHLAIQLSKGAMHMMFRQQIKSVLTAAAGLMVITAVGWGGIALSQTGHKPAPETSLLSSSHGVTQFISAQGVFVAVSQDGLHVSGYSNVLGKWTPLKLEDDVLSELKLEKQPAGTGRRIATNRNVAMLRIGTHLYAYSSVTGTWDEIIVNDLPSDTYEADPDQAVWNCANQLAIFSVYSGKWAWVNWGK